MEGLSLFLTESDRSLGLSLLGVAICSFKFPPSPLHLRLSLSIPNLFLWQIFLYFHISSQ